MVHLIFFILSVDTVWNKCAETYIVGHLLTGTETTFV